MHSGIALNEFKWPLLQARLAKRLRQLGLQSYREYYDHLIRRDPHAEERDLFINASTTNTTAFFREPHHFEYLTREWLPHLRARVPGGAPRTLRVWSSACSTGEEAYSLAITLWHALQPMAGWDVHLLASDIDTDARIRRAPPLPAEKHGDRVRAAATLFPDRDRVARRPV